MRRFAAAIAAVLLLLSATPALSADTVAGICFSPPRDGREDCRSLAVREIDGAEEAIRMLAYSFTDEPIADALIRARKRGADVRLVMDRSNVCAEGNDDEDGGKACGRHGAAIADRLSRAGIEVRIDRKHPILHDKVIILDRHRTITGSMNWTRNGAERNGENLVVLEGRDTARTFAADWEEHRSHSEPYAPASKRR
ncbi:hypothetical protein WV31_10170 [Magnetospirillum sp. ME-1]|uniref:phospholipase D-like domain-containing protein n=1 Tax=Magnetospirillum sp. ME-1 TaxID=1639348 RepID=UPI000A17DBE9|nr:phospholipase D-like domain-containing protein [Magnetospirillum sp. ME-1]ARJ65992.1 hypothetical protein WV31_10170 [Magnetospirillum sp. ME-1]